MQTPQPNKAAPSDTLPHGLVLYQLGIGHYVSRALDLAACLGVADRLSGGPRTAAELAREPALHPPSLRRVMRLLASVGVFEEQADGGFALTPVGELLRSDCRVANGSFFEEISAGTDACLLKHVIHDWGDPLPRGAARRRHADAARRDLPGAHRPLAREPGCGRERRQHAGLHRVRQRSEAEFRELLAGAGFRLDRIVPTPARLCVIEASPA